MGTIVMSGTLVLVVMGFDHHVWWLAAVLVVFLYVRYGQGTSSPASSSGGQGGATGGGASTPGSYRAYRDRRDRQARWERGYRRERPFEARRQAREKGD